MPTQHATAPEEGRDVRGYYKYRYRRLPDCVDAAAPPDLQRTGEARARPWLAADRPGRGPTALPACQERQRPRGAGDRHGHRLRGDVDLAGDRAAWWAAHG